MNTAKAILKIEIYCKIMKIAEKSQYKINNIPQKSFGAIPVAKIKIKSLPASDQITIFRVGKEDHTFLEKLLDKINLESLYTELKDKTDFDRWKEVIESTIINIKYGSSGLLGVRNKKPCGIVSYNRIPSEKKYYIDHEATWPTHPNKGTQCSGKALLRQVFQEAVNDGTQKTIAVPLDLKPRNKTSKDFCKEIGFVENKRYYTQEINSLDNHKKVCEKLDEIMDYEKITNGKNINLNDILNL